MRQSRILLWSSCCPCVPAERCSSLLPGHPRVSPQQLPCVQPLVCAATSASSLVKLSSPKAVVSGWVSRSAPVMWPGYGPGDQGWRSTMPCSEESATYWVIGPDPAHVLVRPINVNDPCQAKPWWSLETLIFPSKVRSGGMSFLGDLSVDLASHLLKKPSALFPHICHHFSPWMQSDWEDKPNFIFLFSPSPVALVHLTFFFLLMDAVILYLGVLNPAH